MTSQSCPNLNSSPLPKSALFYVIYFIDTIPSLSQLLAQNVKSLRTSPLLYTCLLYTSDAADEHRDV